MIKLSKFFVVVSLLLTASCGYSQKMTADKLNKIIIEEADSVTRKNNTWQFQYHNLWVYIIVDTEHNRMRIISPIVKVEDLEKEELIAALRANYHSALDIKYAISDEVMWAIFTHPLKELSGKQVKDAVKQIFWGVATFGTTYSSTDLVFPGTKKE